MWSSLLILLIFRLTVDAQLYYDNVKNYGCRCLLKDQTQEILNSMTANIPRNIAPKTRDPTLPFNLHSKIHFLKKWLSTLALDHPTLPPTTTTTTTTTMDPLALPYEDGLMGNGVFMRLAHKIVGNYFKKLRVEWTILDRFECVCDGNLVELLKSKTFINIQVTHD